MSTLDTVSFDGFEAACVEERFLYTIRGRFCLASSCAKPISVHPFLVLFSSVIFDLILPFPVVAQCRPAALNLLRGKVSVVDIWLILCGFLSCTEDLHPAVLATTFMVIFEPSLSFPVVAYC